VVFSWLMLLSEFLESRSMSRHLSCWLTAVSILIATQPPMAAQEKAKPEKPKEEVKLPNYPRINLATWYEVDPKWPQ
jgi:hypothetical protein